MTCHRVKAPMAAAASALPNATRGCLNPRRPCHDCRAGAAAACRSRSMPRTTPGNVGHGRPGGPGFQGTVEVGPEAPTRAETGQHIDWTGEEPPVILSAV